MVSSFLFDLCDLHVACIRDLITKLEEESLADDLLDAHLHRLISIVVWVVEIWSLWEIWDDLLQKFIESCTRDRINTQIDSLLRIAFIVHVLLGLYADHGLGDLREKRIDTLVLFAILTSRIEKS